MTEHATSEPRGRWTVAAPVTRRGVGLHGGGPCAATVAPAPPGAGLTLNGAPLEAASVIGDRFATTLDTPTGPVRTVEHLLAALRVAGIDDAAITVEGGEAPILDGSAAPWLAALSRRPVAGPPPAPWILDGPVEVRRGDACVRGEPAPAAVIRVEVDFPGLGRQIFEAGEADWATQVAPARTFGFARDEAPLRAAGLIAGVSLDNAVVFDDDGRPRNPGGLRFADEPARHKALDLLGDLALLGAPLRARVIAVRAGHHLHHRFIEAVRRAGRRGG